DAGFSFLSRTLAQNLYGISSGVPNDGAFHQVPVSGARFGLLSQANTLAQTSKPTSTSPTRRGKWVLERLLCDHVPDPPKDAQSTPLPNLPPHPTVRQVIDARMAIAKCATCHARMDPVGISFEHYDPIGKWRTTDNGQAIDTKGDLPLADGTT